MTRFLSGLVVLVFVAGTLAAQTPEDEDLANSLLGEWSYAGGDSFLIRFLPDGTVVWGNGGSPVLWEVRRGLLTIGGLPEVQGSRFQVQDNQLAIQWGGGSRLPFVRNLGAESGAVRGAASETRTMDRLGRPEDYPGAPAGQWLADGARVLEGYARPESPQMVIRGLGSTMTLAVVSSDPAQRITVRRGATATTIQNLEGFLLAIVLGDSRASVEISGVPFNKESGHFNTSAVRYSVPSAEAVSNQAKAILASWQKNENKKWVVFVDADGVVEELVWTER